MKSLIFLVFLVISLASGAQSKYGIVKAYGYSQPAYQGNIPGEDRHKRPDTLYLVFLETKRGIKQSWKKAFVQNTTYNVLQTKVESPFAVGVLKNGSDTITLTTKKGNHLYQLTLEKSEKQPSKLKSKNPSGNKIILLGSRKNKAIYFTVKPIRRLNPNLVM